MNLIQQIKITFLLFSILTLIRVPCCDSSEVTVQASKKPGTSDAVAPWNENSVTALTTSGLGENSTANSTVDKNYPWKDREDDNGDMPCMNDAECVGNVGSDFYCLDAGKLDDPPNTGKKCDCYNYTRPVPPTVKVGKACPCSMKDGRVYPKWFLESDGICRLEHGEICRIGFPEDECRKYSPFGELNCRLIDLPDGSNNIYGKCSLSDGQVAGAYSHVGESILILSIPICLLYFQFGML